MLRLFTGATPRRTVVRDRQRIATPWLYLILAVGLVPFLLMGLRLVALSATGPLGLIAAGEWLNQHLSLQWVGFEDRDVVLYILLLPLAALLIALTRLTLGIRVLGFRSILIAIGMQEIGVLPCLLLILLIAGAVVLVRPSMRRSGMPLYARVAVVLCIVAFTMLGGLLTGAWLDSVTLWSMAFFPVVILAMLAESVADTVARDGVAMAVWRTSTTIALAGVIAGLNQLTPLRELVLSCPELLLTPLALIVFVSEFFDLRLFEDFQPFSKAAHPRPARPRIALVRNRFPEAPPQRLATEVPRRYRQASMQPLIDQLRNRGYEVQVLECDCSLPGKLRTLANDAFGPSGAGLCVLNYSGGMQGNSRLSQVPVICELLGVPHTGPDAHAAVLRSDRLSQLAQLRAAGLQVPSTITHDEARHALEAGREGFWVRPRFQTDRGAIRVDTARGLKAAWSRTERRFGDAIIERIPAGRPLTAIVQNPEAIEAVRVLPLLERGSGRQAFRSEAELTADQNGAVVDQAIRAARVLGCRDATRVDLYSSESGDVTVARVVAIEPLTTRSATGVAAGLNGLSLSDIAEQSLHAALTRASANEPGRSSITFDSSIRIQCNNNRSPPPCTTSASSVMT